MRDHGKNDKRLKIVSLEYNNGTTFKNIDFKRFPRKGERRRANESKTIEIVCESANYKRERI